MLDVRRSYFDEDQAIAVGRLRTTTSVAFDRLQRLLAEQRRTPLIESTGDGIARVIGLPETVTGALRRRSRLWVNALLFLATIVTTVWAGALHHVVQHGLQRPF